jgi:hypothetical protein
MKIQTSKFKRLDGLQNDKGKEISDGTVTIHHACRRVHTKPIATLNPLPASPSEGCTDK